MQLGVPRSGRTPASQRYCAKCTAQPISPCAGAEQQFGIAETAEFLHVSRSNATTRLARAGSTLRERLAARWLSLGRPS